MMNKLDELSQAIDELNAGHQPPESNKENTELLTLAALLKKADFPARPPSHILKLAVQCAENGLNLEKARRRKSWMYSGVLGAAASLMLFLGIHGLPDWPGTSTTTPAPQVSQPVDIPLNSAAPGKKQEQPPTPPVATDSQPASSSPAVAVQKSLPTEPNNIAGSSVPPAPSPKASPSSNPVPSGPVVKSAPQPPAILPLRIPGRTPDSIHTDSTAGTLRQVYGSGTPQEIIITQQLQPQADNAASSQPKVFAAREAGKNATEKPNAINKVIVTIAGQEVTLEGRKTRQELMDLAATLTP
jgi:hypothetical protein